MNSSTTPKTPPSKQKFRCKASCGAKNITFGTKDSVTHISGNKGIEKIRRRNDVKFTVFCFLKNSTRLRWPHILLFAWFHLSTSTQQWQWP